MLRLAAALTFVLAAASTAWWGPVPRFLIAVVGVLLLVAAALVGLRATWTGLIARGTAWAAVSLGMIVVHLNAADRCEVARHALGASVVTVLAACAGLALAGPAGQRDPSSRFAPARLGGVLQLALVLAVADAVMLGLFAVTAIVPYSPRMIPSNDKSSSSSGQ